jgi:hypothetical protein
MSVTRRPRHLLRRAGRLYPPAAATLALAIAAGGTSWGTALIHSANIANNAVLSRHIKDGEVKTADLGSHAVTSAKLASHAVNSSALAAKGVGTAALADGSVTPAKLSVAAKPGPTVFQAQAAGDSATGQNGNYSTVESLLDMPVGSYLVLGSAHVYGTAHGFSAQCVVEAGGVNSQPAETPDGAGDWALVTVDATATLGTQGNINLNCTDDADGWFADDRSLIAIPLAFLAK